MYSDKAGPVVHSMVSLPNPTCFGGKPSNKNGSPSIWLHRKLKVFCTNSTLSWCSEVHGHCFPEWQFGMLPHQFETGNFPIPTVSWERSHFGMFWVITMENPWAFASPFVLVETPWTWWDVLLSVVATEKCGQWSLGSQILTSMALSHMNMGYLPLVYGHWKRENDAQDLGVWGSNFRGKPHKTITNLHTILIYLRFCKRNWMKSRFHFLLRNPTSWPPNPGCS